MLDFRCQISWFAGDFRGVQRLLGDLSVVGSMIGIRLPTRIRALRQKSSL